MRHFGDILFRGAVKDEQTRRGSRDAYAKMTAGLAPDGLSPREAGFIAARDSFYMASVSEDGWQRSVTIPSVSLPLFWSFLSTIFTFIPTLRFFLWRPSFSAVIRPSSFLCPAPWKARARSCTGIMVRV